MDGIWMEFGYPSQLKRDGGKDIYKDRDNYKQ